MKKDFYQEKIEKIQYLIQEKRYEEAYEKVMEEIKMPYIPLVYEKQFKLFEFDLNAHLNKNVFKESISLAKAIEMLYGDNKEQIIALETFPKHNLRNVKNDLKKRIESWNDNFKKALLYELLVEQEINIDIKINNKIFNPINFSIFKNKETIKAFKKIEDLTFKMPHLLDPVTNELQRYLLINFPKLRRDGSKLGTMIFNIVISMFDKEKSLSLEEQKIKQTLNFVK